jgi:Protein of unknown function (DUF3168).
MIKQALVSILANNPGVADLAGDRVFPQIIPQEDFDGLSKKPCIVYQRTGVGRQQTLCGTSPTMSSVFSIDCYAQTYAGAEALANAVRTALVDYRGSVAGVRISTAILDNEIDLLDIEPGLHRVSMTFTIWHDAP